MNLSSYLKDTTSFLTHIQGLNRIYSPFNSRTILVTADVTSLYTNIPHSEGLSACRKALDTRQVPIPPTQDLMRLLELTLKLNNFQFNGRHYIQTQGTAMGTPVAPSYANIFMGMIEAKINAQPHHGILEKSWVRYIDDIQFIWSKSPRSLTQFQNELNLIHPTIKFTFDSSQSEVHFLDTSLMLQNNRLETELYTKPTDTHSYLLPSSSHPKHTIASIPYSQALRVRRICSTKMAEETSLCQLETHFIARNYDPHSVKEAINRAKRIPRADLLTYKPKPAINRVPLVTTYSPTSSQLPSILNKALPLLHESETLGTTFPQPPLTSFRRGRTLRDLLVKAKHPQPHNKETRIPGFYKCTANKCIIHKHLREGNKFGSSSTGQKFPITSYMNCKSTWVIYLITCQKCTKQYVGKTENTLYTRFNNTRSEINNFHTSHGKPLPYTIHFNQPDHSINDIQISAIESITNQSHTTILKRESFWIHKLRTKIPHGINFDD